MQKCPPEFVNFFGKWSILEGVADVLMSDADLVALARAGETDALAGLLERYRTSLYAAAIGLLRNREDALDAVQETCLVALARLDSLQDPTAVGGWLHAILRNTCFMRLRRISRDAPNDRLVSSGISATPGPEDILDEHALRAWVWTAMDALNPDDRATVMLRYFTRCRSYQAIAAVTGVPVGTVRSRLNRSRSQLTEALRRTAKNTPLSQAELERSRFEEWKQFYSELHEAPVPRTYRSTYSPEVEVTDPLGQWHGVAEWSAHEREAIALGVRATIRGLSASRDITIIEIDFANPTWADDHCPPRSTFVHHIAEGRSHRLAIHYV